MPADAAENAHQGADCACGLSGDDCYRRMPQAIDEARCDNGVSQEFCPDVEQTGVAGQNFHELIENPPWGFEGGGPPWEPHCTQDAGLDDDRCVNVLPMLDPRSNELGAILPEQQARRILLGWIKDQIKNCAVSENFSRGRNCSLFLFLFLIFRLHWHSPSSGRKKDKGL